MIKRIAELLLTGGPDEIQQAIDLCQSLEVLDPNPEYWDALRYWLGRYRLSHERALEMAETMLLGNIN